MTKFIAIRTAPGVDIWDLFADDVDIGCLTVFPGEGPMATVHSPEEGNESKTTIYNAVTIHEALVRAKEAYLDLINPKVQAWIAAQMEQDDEDYIEDEDGEIAYMKMVEARNERTDWGDEPHWC